MTKAEEKRKEALKEATEIFADKTKEQANKYIAENITTTKLTKALMASYIKKFATAEDKKWYKETFVPNSKTTTTRKVKTVCVDNKGVPIRKLNKKGEAVVETARVERLGGETYEKFDISKARSLFMEHFGITTKAGKFTPKAKREEPKFDEFADMFD